MAISKTQNERPAITALIDAVNADEQTLAQHTADIANLGQDLADEVIARAAGDDALTRALSATNGQLSELETQVDGIESDLAAETLARQAADTTINRQLDAANAQIGTLTDSVTTINGDIENLQDDTETLEGNLATLSGDVAGIQGTLSGMKVGETESISVAAGQTATGSVTFAAPFASGAECIVLVQPISTASLSLFEVSVTACTRTGFSYSITNSDAAAQTAKIGYVAFKTN